MGGVLNNATKPHRIKRLEHRLDILWVM